MSTDAPRPERTDMHDLDDVTREFGVDLNPERVKVGDRVRLWLSTPVPGAWHEGTVTGLDTSTRPGVAIDLDRGAEGATVCYATYDEVEVIGTPRPERVTLTDEEREALARSVAATINYHSFDAAAETADFDMADAILDTNLAATSAGLVMTVERILAAREQALREEIEAIAADALTIAAALVRSQGEDRTHVVDGQKRHLSAIAKGIHHRLARIARGETR